MWQVGGVHLPQVVVAAIRDECRLRHHGRQSGHELGWDDGRMLDRVSWFKHRESHDELAAGHAVDGDRARAQLVDGIGNLVGRCHDLPDDRDPLGDGTLQVVGPYV